MNEDNLEKQDFTTQTIEKQKVHLNYFHFRRIFTILFIIIGVVIVIGTLKLLIDSSNTTKQNSSNCTSGACPSIQSSSPTIHLPASSSTRNGAQISWIIQNHFLELVQTNSSALQELSKSEKIYAILSKKEAANGNIGSITGLTITPTVYYNSYAQYVSDYANGKINGIVKAVVFDDSADTPARVVPPIEAKNPFKYDQLLTQFAHQHGMVSMCDYILGIRIGSKQGEAPPCDIALLNYSQQSERVASDYQKKVTQAVDTIRKTNPSMPILVGLSTNPRGTPITSDELTAATIATYKEVAGFWISIPTSGGIGCPNCSQQNSSILPLFLAELAKNNIY